MSDGLSKRAADGTAYDLRGPPGAPVLVLIHGLGLCRSLWDVHLPAFAECRVLRYDLYGHGDSAPAPRMPSLALYADQIAGLLNETGIARATLVGFSIGGMINRRFAMDHAGRLQSLVILNSPHDRGTEGQAAVEARAAQVRDQGTMATLPDALKRWFTPAHLAEGPGPARVREWRERVDADSYAGAAWVLAHGVRELIAPQPPIAAPTLVMTCENDSGSTPAMSHDIAAEIAGAETLILPHLKHLGLIEDPDSFTGPILDFLRRTLP
ncbi:MAG: alpha/beta fold hydrolase [Pseudomonadota bacterium]